MDCDYLDLIKKSFDTLWRCKSHGEEIEIISPYLSTDSKFVSLFISQQKNEFVVSEGGLLQEAMMEVEEYDEKYFNLALEHYMKFYNVKEWTFNKAIKRYYKKTDKIELVPALVFEMSQFFGNVCSSLYIQDTSQKDDAEERFRDIAKGFFRAHYKDKVVFNKPLIPNYKRIRFNAVVQTGNRFHAFAFASGSNKPNFESSLNKGIVNFEILESIRSDIGERIGIIHDEAEGYSEAIAPRLDALRRHSTHEPILWKDRQEILSVVSAN